MNKMFAFLLALVMPTHICFASMPLPRNTAQDLCSTDGLMRLIPQLKNKEGKFEIPDPSLHPKAFLDIHTSLTNIIDMALIQASFSQNPYQESKTKRPPLKFNSAWRSAEVGLQTNGQTLSFPDNNKFASYGGVSFMSGITPLKQGAGYYYSIHKPDGSIPAIIYIQPTVLPCVNRVDLAAANTVGSWLSPTYALGTVQGDAYLVVDKCLDLGHVITQQGNQYLAPNAILFSAMQWADVDGLKHMRTNQKGHTH